MKTKKVSFFVIDYSQGGGVERVTSDLMQLFIDNNIPVYQLLSLHQSNAEPLVKFPDNVEIKVLNPKKKSEMEQYFIQHFTENPTDILIFQGDNVTISKTILNATEKCGVRAIPQYHGSPYAYLCKFPDALKSNWDKRFWASVVYPFKKMSLKNYLKKVKEPFVCVSEGVKEELKDIFKNETFTQNIISIRNPTRIQFLEGEKQNIISFVSRLERKHKNAFLIVKAWNIIHKQNSNWTLNIYGTGILEQKMKAFCQENDIQNIQFKGFTKDIAKELSISSISVSTSDCEGLPMSIAEALACKNAVAITDSRGGISDMVIHNETGLVSERNNADTLAKNIQILIDNKELRDRLANNGQQKIKEILGNNILEKWKGIL